MRLGEKEFWAMTPKMLTKLLEVHLKMLEQGRGAPDESVKMGTIDQIKGW